MKRAVKATPPLRMISGPPKFPLVGVNHHVSTSLGSYAYVESSNHKKGDQAWLASKVLEFPTPQCMSFYYSMYGKLTGSLTLYIAPEGKKWIKLLVKSGNQGPNWQNADVTLDYKGKFQVSIIAGLFSVFIFILFCFYDFRHKDKRENDALLPPRKSPKVCLHFSFHVL